MRLIDAADADTLAADVLRGLTASPKWLPPKHFYDEVGGALFDAICDLPEYYPTRTEQGLLERHAGEIISTVQPTHLVELGSGSSRKTRVLLNAMGRLERVATYVPLDINEAQLDATARTLLQDYPWLWVRALVADFERPIAHLPWGGRVLVAFLGGTIGNFDPPAATALLNRVARAVGPGGWMLLGTDRVKDPRRLADAYNDAQGITARFNLNVLDVINRRLDADFRREQFEHVAFYDREQQRIEMHLRSLRAQVAHVPRLDLTVRFQPNEMLRTEISRKFTADSARAQLEEAGFEVVRHFTPDDEAYSLWLARVSHPLRAPTRVREQDALASTPEAR